MKPLKKSIVSPPVEKVCINNCSKTPERKSLWKNVQDDK